MAALRLLEEKEGPVLADFGEEVPAGSAGEDAVGACPISFAQPEKGERPTAKELADALKEEMLQLRPWYDLALQKYGRTTVGVSGMDLPEVADFLGAFLQGRPANPPEDMALADSLKLAVDDLKAFYSEAMAAQPGETPTSTMLSAWFWRQTTAASVLHEIRRLCLESSDEMLQVVGRVLLIPMRAAAEREAP
ncbi:MAG: hypothetical protein PF568_03310 [Deltaproteobacteria bacterium]|nr:hypothetical protein [Deltaproteobacteria bacterium]